MHRLKFAALRVCIRKENVNLIIMGTLRKKRNLYLQQTKMNPQQTPNQANNNKNKTPMCREKNQ